MSFTFNTTPFPFPPCIFNTRIAIHVVFMTRKIDSIVRPQYAFTAHALKFDPVV